MDVLLHSAYNEQRRINEFKANTQYFQAMQTVANQLLSPNTAHDTSLWEMIPGLPQGCVWSSTCSIDNVECSGTICVYDDTGYYVCNKCCQWTVPPGATLARFQIWGPGAPSAGANCCGIAPFGASGAYGSVIIPVTPGDSYTLCAGCSNSVCGYCGCMCFSCNGASGGEGTPSFVVGNGLYNFCALGGSGSLYEGMKARACSAGRCDWIAANCCRYFNIRNTGGGNSGGGCICGGGFGAVCNFGAETCGDVPLQADWLRGVCGCAQYGIVFKIPSLHQALNFDTNQCGTAYNQVPMPALQGTNYCCFVYGSFSFTSTCNPRCMGLMWCNNQNVVMGSGGTFGAWFGGCTGDCTYGDRGRGGMVMVQWM